MQNLIDKASVLQEALPYIRQFHGKIFVIKYGGHAMVNPALRDSFARDVVLMKYVGLNPVVVHGGGPQIDAMLKSMGVVSERLEGLRVTDDATMEVVEMVLGGKINQEIVALIGNHGGRAVGLTGKDDTFMEAEKIAQMPTKSGNLIDPGRVGRVHRVRPDLPLSLMNAGFIPVISPVAISAASVHAKRQSLNVNADTAAGCIAQALNAHKLVLMTDIEGVQDAAGHILGSLTPETIQQLKTQGIIHSGMVPKVDCALEALRGGVEKVHIIDGRVQHAMLLEIFTDQGIGTEITQA